MKRMILIAVLLVSTAADAQNYRQNYRFGRHRVGHAGQPAERNADCELNSGLGHLCLQHYPRGMAMRWFSQSKPKEIWDEEIQWPLGDLEAARRIREICDSASVSAEKVGIGGAETKAGQCEAQRYQRAAKTAMEIAIKISDDLLRDSAVCRIVGLCVKANDLKTAGILFRAVHSVSIRENIMNEHPALRP
jgi:hypothetical protein